MGRMGTGDTAPHDHLVQFYETDAFLADAVRSFLTPGLQGPGAAVSLATAAHNAALAESLTTWGVPVPS